MTAPSIKEALELKPCPFCNTAPAFGRMIEPDQVTIGCNNDGCLVQLCVVSDVESEAVKAWNTRATFQPDGERREAIDSLINNLLAAEDDYSGSEGDARSSAWDALREARRKLDVAIDNSDLASGLVQNEAGWRDISTAKKDRTPIIAKFFDDIYPRIEPNRPDLENWNGLQVVIRHPGIPDSGFDIGWNVAAPVGNGGLPDRWIEGWMPLPIRSARNGGAS